MGFLSFLKKAGQFVIKASTDVTGAEPIIQALEQEFPQILSGKVGTTIGTVQTDLQELAGIVGVVEQVGASFTPGMTGEQKLAAVVPQVSAFILRDPFFQSKKIADPVLFNKAVTEMSQSIVDLLNSISGDATLKT